MPTEIDDLANPPAPPRSARTAGLRVELTTVPPIVPRRHARRRPRIAWSRVLYYFLPYLVLAACIIAAVLLTRGAPR